MTPSTPTVLILSDDTVGAALLGLLAELAGYAPAFMAPGEQPGDAVDRVRPLHVVLLDATLDAARSDLFFGRAAGRRVGIAVLRCRGDAAPLAAWARERDVPCLEIPCDTDQFARVIEAAVASQWWRSGVDRRAPRAEHDAAGKLTFVDRLGQRWRVYDRRGSDRRRSPAAADVRVFVDDAGDTWGCALIPGDDRSPAALERQLARAHRVTE